MSDQQELDMKRLLDTIDDQIDDGKIKGLFILALYKEGEFSTGLVVDGHDTTELFGAIEIAKLKLINRAMESELANQ